MNVEEASTEEGFLKENDRVVVGREQELGGDDEQENEMSQEEHGWETVERPL